MTDTKQDITSARSLLERGRKIYLPHSVLLWIKSAEVEECAGTELDNIARYEKAKEYLIEIDRLKEWGDSEILLQRIAFERRHRKIDRCCKLFESAMTFPSTSKENVQQHFKGHEAEMFTKDSSEVDENRSEPQTLTEDGKVENVNEKMFQNMALKKGVEEPKWRMNLSATGRAKIAIFHAYFLVEEFGNVDGAR